MRFSEKISTLSTPNRKSFATINKILLQGSFFNLFLVTILGLLLRSSPFIALPVQYKNLVHAHSHFAFGGWLQPFLIWLIVQYYPAISEKISFTHFRNIVLLTFISAYGMLFSFPFQGYGPVSIVFSTVSIASGYYLAIVAWRLTRDKRNSVSVKFLRAGLFYFLLSSIGPFALAPIIKMGMTETPLYHNAIYFYLHFQYNGWFSFVILGVLLKLIEDKKSVIGGNKIFTLFNFACIPSFFLSLLWSQPGIIFNLIGGIAALLQLTGLFYLLKNASVFNGENRFTRFIGQLAITAFSAKIVLQCISALPFAVQMTVHNRNIIIAYLHLVLLGFITLSGLTFLFMKLPRLNTRSVQISVLLFLFSFVTTELLLILSAAGVYLFSSFTILILAFSTFFMVGAAGLFRASRKIYRNTGDVLNS